MTTVGEILRLAREKKHLSLAQVEAAIKIRSKFLEAIEKNEFESMPPGTFVRGFIKNYASFLGVSPDDALAFYRRQTTVERQESPTYARSARVKQSFRLTPQLFTAASITFLLALFFGYLIYSYATFAGAPPLTVETPQNNSVTKSDQAEVKGKTDPEAALTINDEAVSVNESGLFSQKLTLKDGINTLKVVATNKFKKQSTVSRTVRLEK